MPFDLEATTHRFEPVKDGLLQTVVADNPRDAEQVRLVRQHLASEAERFAAGDYSDPASIHGDDMPGLAELETGAEDIRVRITVSPRHAGHVQARRTTSDMIATARSKSATGTRSLCP